jgi:hypothetical protein
MAHSFWMSRTFANSKIVVLPQASFSATAGPAVTASLRSVPHGSAVSTTGLLGRPGSAVRSSTRRPTAADTWLGAYALWKSSLSTDHTVHLCNLLLAARPAGASALSNRRAMACLPEPGACCQLAASELTNFRGQQNGAALEVLSTSKYLFFQFSFILSRLVSPV